MNTDRPMAARGLTSYRYPGRYGWIMIGAKDHQDAINEANRALSGGSGAKRMFLEIWDTDSGKYVRVGKSGAQLSGGAPCHYTI